MPEAFDILSFTDRAVELLREVEERLAVPNASSAPDYTALLREHGSLLKVATTRNEILDLRRQIEDCNKLLESGDAEMIELAREELTPLKEKHDRMLAELEEKLVLSDEDSERNVIVEIRAGTGGEEAALFAGDLFRMYSLYADSVKWKIEILEGHRSEHDGFKEITFSMAGDGVYRRMRYEAGGHRVQRVPETEASGRIHTSAATVAVLPEVEEVEVEIKTEDLRVDTYSAGGPGGQHVNKTQSAVRLTHIPTGVVVACQDERSQHKNKARALRILRARVYEIQREIRDRERSTARKAMIGSGDRSDRIRTYNFPQNRLSDHRAELTLYSLDRIMSGNLEPLFASLFEYDKKTRLEQLQKDLEKDPGLLFKR